MKTGTFTDKNNQTVTIDEASLDKVIASTDLTKEPQFVIEHPKFDEIGFGSIEQLKRVGSYLFALPKTVEEKFKKIVNSGKLPGRSVTLDKNTFSLKNISFLPPQVPPAVSGLGAYSFCLTPSLSKREGEGMQLQLGIPGVESHFADLEASNFEFAQYEVSKSTFLTIQTLLRNIKNYFIEKDSLENAEKILPEYYLSEVGTPPYIWEKPQEQMTNIFSQNTDGDKMDITKIDLSKVDPALKAAIEELQNQKTALQSDLDAKKVELSTATTKITEAERAALQNQVLQFCASDDVKLKVKPAIKDKVVNFLMAQKERAVIEFSAADNTKVQLNCFEFAQELIKSLPDVVDPIELATKDKANTDQSPDYLKTAKAIADSVK